MPSEEKLTESVKVEELAAELGRVEELADRVVLAGHGLAAPLLAAHAANADARWCVPLKRKGADHPDVACRAANVARAEVRLGLVAEELERARVDRPAPAADGEATVWGRVADDGVAVADVTVSVISDGKRLDYRCTDEVGAFAMAVPVDSPYLLSVRAKDGSELFRDDEPATLADGQQRRREIDLTRSDGRPCPPPPDEPGEKPPDTTTVVMPDLVGKTEKAARAAIKKLGLELAERREESVMGPGGLIESHDPAAGLDVSAGDPVSIVVGVDAWTEMPDVVGMHIDEAGRVLKQANLDVGDVQRTPADKELTDRVIGQEPAAGEPVAPGTAATLTVGGPAEDGEDAEPFIRVCTIAETRLRKNETIPAEEPQGTLLRMLYAGDVVDIDGLDELLKRDRREVRELLDLGTLARTDRTIAAVKSARRGLEG